MIGRVGIEDIQTAGSEDDAPKHISFNIESSADNVDAGELNGSGGEIRHFGVERAHGEPDHASPRRPNQWWLEVLRQLRSRRVTHHWENQKGRLEKREERGRDDDTTTPVVGICDVTIVEWENNDSR